VSPQPIAGRRAVALSATTIGIGLVGDTLLYAVLPLYHAEFGIGLVMVGVLLSLNRWVRLVGNTLVAAMGERFGPRRLMIVAAVGSAISTTIYGTGAGEAWQMLARALWGLSFAALNLGSLAFAVSDKANAGARVGLGRAIIGLYQVAALIGGTLLVVAIGPLAAFLALGVATLLALVSALLLPELPAEASGQRGFSLPRPGRLDIWGFLLGFSGDGVFLLTLAFLLRDSVTAVPAVVAAALVLSLRPICEATTGPLGGWLADRIGARGVTVATALVMIAGYLAIAGGVDLAGSILVTLARGLFSTLIPVMVLERSEGRYLASQATFSTWRDFGAAVGPLTAPFLFLNVPQAPLFAGLAAVLAVGLWFCVARR